MIEERQQKSALKNGNPKIGRPAKTDQEEQFKQHYLENKKKFQLQCQLLVYIHSLFFDQIPTHPRNTRVDVSQIVRLYDSYGCLPLFKSLASLNQVYYKNSSTFPQQKLKYTSIIDLGYLVRQAKLDYQGKVSPYQLILLLLFFLYNQKVVNPHFFDYFKQNIESLRNGMINGPEYSKLKKIDVLIVGLALQIAVREGVMIEQQVQQDQNGEFSKQQQMINEQFMNQVQSSNNKISSSSSSEEEMDQQGDQCKMQSVDLNYHNDDEEEESQQS